MDAVFPPACAACDGPTSGVLCARCSESVEPAPSQIWAAFMYGGAVADAVRHAKFRPHVSIAASLARLWVEHIVQERAPAIPPVDAITFIPAPLRRRIARGFDFPALLAGALAQHAGVPVVDALACRRHDAPLSLGADKAARALAVSGRYRARSRFDGQRMLLVDDVHTTGATLGEGARMLEHAGASVVTAAFAVAP